MLTTWTTEQGLPQNFITSLAQTSDGFLWVGTMNGLVRFDGLHFSGFSQDGPPELQGFIGALVKDGGDGLWIDKTGTATIPFNAPSGDYYLIANWAGDANYTNGGWKSKQEIITQSTAGTKTVNIGLNLGTRSFSLGQRTEYSVAVTSAAQGSTAVPISYVTLYSNNGQISGQLALSGGRASGIVEWDAVGSQGVYAVYNGDGNYAGANSAPVTVHVAQAVPTVTEQAGATHIAVGAQTSVTASLISQLASTNAPAPTGTIQFFDAVNGGEARPVSVPQAVVGGYGGMLIATLALTLPKGTNLVTAVYSGDVNWKSAVSLPVAIAVTNHGRCGQNEDCDDDNATPVAWDAAALVSRSHS